MATQHLPLIQQLQEQNPTPTTYRRQTIPQAIPTNLKNMATHPKPMGKLLMLTNGGITRGMDAGVLATKCKYTTLWNAVPEHTPTDRDTLYVQIHTLNHIHKTKTQQTFI